MNPELQRQHEAHKARQARLYPVAPMCRAISAPTMRSGPLPKPISPFIDWRTFTTQFDEHVIAWRRQNAPLWRDILRAVCAATGASLDDLLGTSKLRAKVVPRQIAMLLLVDDAGLTLPQAAYRLGGKDHTTILHGLRRMRAAMLTDDDIAADIAAARAMFAEKLRHRREARG